MIKAAEKIVVKITLNIVIKKPEKLNTSIKKNIKWCISNKVSKYFKNQLKP